MGWDFIGKGKSGGMGLHREFLRESLVGWDFIGKGESGGMGLHREGRVWWDGTS